jgi:signal transduction histidine kinase
MSESINRLLLLARFDTMHQPNLRDIDLSSLVKDTVDQLETWSAARDQTIDVCHREPCLMLRADPVAVREALRNLVENAVTHTPPGTKIRVSVGPGATITVEDGGPGLPEDSSIDLFEPFRKGKSSTEGAGLGLTIVRRAIELHGGSIETGRSALGGAMFIWRFPASLNPVHSDVPRRAQLHVYEPA